MQHNGALDAGAVGGVFQLRHQRRVVVGFHHAGFAPQLQPAAVGVVHQDQRHARVATEVAHRQVLAIAAKVGVGQRVRVQYLQKAGRAAAVLHVGPAVTAAGGLVEAVAGGDEHCLGRAQRSAAVRPQLETVVGVAAVVAGLRRFHVRRKGEGGEGAWHGGLPKRCTCQCVPRRAAAESSCRARDYCCLRNDRRGERACSGSTRPPPTGWRHARARL